MLRRQTAKRGPLKAARFVVNGGHPHPALGEAADRSLAHGAIEGLTPDHFKPQELRNCPEGRPPMDPYVQILPSGDNSPTMP